MTRMLAVPILLMCTAQAMAQGFAPQDRTRVLRNIVIGTSETALDVECFACNVRVRGHVTGDIAVFGGNITVEGLVDGDAAAVGGRVEVRSRGKIIGDAAAIGGYVKADVESAIQGDKVSAPYILIPGQYRPTILGSLALAALNLLFVAIAFAVLQQRRVENISQVVRSRIRRVLIHGIIALPVFFGLFLLCDQLGRAADPAELSVLILFVLIASAGGAGLGSSVAKIAFPEVKGIRGTLVGIFALTLVELAPLLGFFVFSVGLLLSLGAALLSRFGARGAPMPAQPAC